MRNSIIERTEKANVAQLVERQLPKLDVAGSNPVIRSFLYIKENFTPEL